MAYDTENNSGPADVAKVIKQTQAKIAKVEGKSGQGSKGSS